MYVVNNENFEDVVDMLKGLSSSYHSATVERVKGIIFLKDENMIKIVNHFSVTEIENVDIQVKVPPMKPFWDIISDEWEEIPHKSPLPNIKDLVEKAEFIGRTEYNNKNILIIMNKEYDKVSDLKTRYVFSQGFLPEGCMCAQFKIINGEPIFEIPNFPKKFVVSENSSIPKEYLKEKIIYQCGLDDQGDVVVLDVISKFGKTKSGLITTDIAFDCKSLPSVNSFFGIHPELMTCSNMLDINKDENDEPLTMPPIHVPGKFLYDIMFVFNLCKNGFFYIHFQERNLNSNEKDRFILLESSSKDKDEPKIRVILTPIQLYERGIQNA